MTEETIELLICMTPCIIAIIGGVIIGVIAALKIKE